MEEHPLIQSGVAPGVQINSSVGNVLDVEYISRRRVLSLPRLRRVSCRQNNSEEQNGNDCETAQLALLLSSSMALIAIYTVVHIPVLVRVPEIGRDIVPMATGALEDRVGRASAQGIQVASEADAPGIAMIDIKPGVSKRRSQPACRVVARRACGLEDSGSGGVGGEVIWYRPTQRCGALPLSVVATSAIEWRWS